MPSLITLSATACRSTIVFLISNPLPCQRMGFHSPPFASNSQRIPCNFDSSFVAAAPASAAAVAAPADYSLPSTGAASSASAANEARHFDGDACGDGHGSFFNVNFGDPDPLNWEALVFEALGFTP